MAPASMIRALILVSAALAFLISVDDPLAEPFDCKADNCGILTNAPYPNLVVGTIDGITTKSQTEALFLEVKKLGLWQVFPSNAEEFADKIQPVSIMYSPGRSVTVLADYNEVHWSWMKVGEMIRFAPHRGLHEKPRPNDPYWVGIGCVVLLCAGNDSQCQGNYRPGLYRLADGHELDAQGKKVVAGGTVINPLTMLIERGGN